MDIIKYHTWPRTPYGKVTKTQENVTENSPFPAGDRKAARNRQDSMTDTHKKTNKNDPQKKHRLGTARIKILKGSGLNIVYGTNLTFFADMDQDKYIFGSHERCLTHRCIISNSKIRTSIFEILAI